MLTRVDITTKRNTILTLNMGEDDSGYRVKDIKGLNPVAASLVSSSVAGVDGEEFQSERRVARNIVFSIDLEPDPETDTYTSLRDNLYSYLMPGSRILMRFYMSTGLYVDIAGYIETHEAGMFSSDPDVQVSVMCYKPDFIDPRTVTLSGHTVADGTTTDIDYPGNVETGTLFTLNVNRTLTGGFTLYNTGDDGQLFQLDFTGDLVSGDQLVVSSVQGSKGIVLTRGGVPQSYLYARSVQSSWIKFFEGTNRFRAYAPGAIIPYQLQYAVRYGGL